LLARPGEGLESLRRVYSHPQALAQCDAFLRQHRLEPMPAYDTAGSAKMVAEQRLAGAGAIAGRAAATIYGLSCSLKASRQSLQLHEIPQPRARAGPADAGEQDIRGVHDEKCARRAIPALGALAGRA